MELVLLTALGVGGLPRKVGVYGDGLAVFAFSLVVLVVAVVQIERLAEYRDSTVEIALLD